MSQTKEEKDLLGVLRKDKFQTTPIREYKLLLEMLGLLNKPDYVLKRKQRHPKRNRSDLIKNQLIYAAKRGGNIVSVVFADPNEGKSTATISIATMQKGINERIFKKKCKIYLTFNTWETIKFIAEASKGDIIIQDETKRDSGAGSRSILQRITNILQNFREKQISVYIIRPDPVQLKGVCSFYIEADAICLEKEMNRLLVYDGRDFKPLFHFYVKKNRDTDLQNYDKRKKENIKRLIESRGYSSVEYPDRMVDKDIKKTVDYLKNRLDEIPTHNWKMRHIKIAVKRAPVYGDSSYRELIEDEVYMLKEKKALEYEQKKNQQNEGASGSSSNDTFSNSTHTEEHKLPSLNDSGITFDQLLQQTANNFMLENNLVEDISFAKRWTLRYLSTYDMSYSEIAIELGENRGDTVGRWIRSVGKSRFLSKTQKGEILERTLEAWLDAYLAKKRKIASSQDSSESKKLGEIKFLEGFSWQRLGGKGSCDLHLVHQAAGNVFQDHILCINAKLKTAKRPSFELLCLPEFENNPQHSYIALWSPLHSIQIFQCEKREISSGSCEDIGLSGLYDKIDLVITQLYARYLTHT